MFNYAIVFSSVFLFGLSFLFNQMFEKEKGNGYFQAFYFSLYSGVAGLIVLLAINGFKVEYTHFTLIMATLWAINNLAFTFCSLKAFAKINLSLYSLFSMLGGMVLPFIAGVLFFGEKMTIAKALCLVIVTFALILTVERNDEKKNSGFIHYVGIFVLNGLSGVISTIFTKAPFPQTSAEGFSILAAVVTVALSEILLVIFWDKDFTVSAKSLAVSAGNGSIANFANFLLVLALAKGFDASLQYPIVTGGVMIVSTVISALTGQKPSKKEVLAVALSFVGLVVLVAIPF